MQTQPELGLNRTGVATSPKLAGDMVQGSGEFPPSSVGDERELASVRTEYARGAEPIGHVPPPLTVKGMAKTAFQALKGATPIVLQDKLGERLGFERTGIRLYEAILSKFDAGGRFAGGPARSELEQILAEEYAHFHAIEIAVEKLGGDPTVITPSAALHMVLTRGIVEATVDARTTLAQCLEAALAAELLDNEGWLELVRLVKAAGDDQIAQSFLQALRDEEEHLIRVRKWVMAAHGK